MLDKRILIYFRCFKKKKVKSSFSDLWHAQDLCGSVTCCSICGGMKVVTYSLAWIPISVLLLFDLLELFLFIKGICYHIFFSKAPENEQIHPKEAGKGTKQNTDIQFLNLNANTSFSPLFVAFLCMNFSICIMKCTFAGVARVL